MDIQTRKIEFIQAFLKLDDENLVSVFEDILKSETNQDFQPMSIDELNERIDISERNFKTAEFKTHEEVFSKYMK